MAKRKTSGKKTVKRGKTVRPAAKKPAAKAKAARPAAKAAVKKPRAKTPKLVVRPRPRGALVRRKDATQPRVVPHKSGPHLGALELSARDHPDHPAFFRGDEAVSQLELLTRCRRLASGLVKAGLERGDMVMILISQPGALMEALHGVALAGGEACVLDATAGAEALTAIIGQFQTRLLIADVDTAALSEQLLTVTSQKPHMILSFD